MPTYNRVDLAFERGEGPYLFSADGTRYLDFACGIAVTALGHSHPHLVAALTEQAGKFWHCSNIFQIPDQQRLGERLVEATFADTAFFGNSGAEAVECGIKIIRKYQHATGNPEKYRIITCSGAFHGRTLATIFAAGQDKLVDGFGPAVEGFDHVAFGNLNELRAAIGGQTGGILVEPVQGEAGIKVADLDYIRGLRQVADEFGLLLMFDEIQCGMGRTGRLFAHEWAGIAPDVMAVAKGLGGGFPVGACLATENAAQGMVAGTHGSTFGGNPLAMAVANAVLDVILAGGFLVGVERIAGVLYRRLEGLVSEYPSVFEEARGLGLMLGLKCAVPNAEMLTKLRQAGLLTVAAADNVVRLLPPLVIEESHIDEALDILERTAASWFDEGPNGNGGGKGGGGGARP
jgi:acetylornithine/N-succinyldiaminopimelate aminotransferase